MVWLLRILLLALIIFFISMAIRYILDPIRKLDLAHRQRKFFLLDVQENVKKNFLLTYKGVLFEGEKYLGQTASAFEVVSIIVWPKDNPSLKGLVRDDFLFLEKKILEHYPAARLDWKSPVKELLGEQ